MVTIRMVFQVDGEIKESEHNRKKRHFAGWFKPLSASQQDLATLSCGTLESFQTNFKGKTKT
jgi:hypothetical protein